MTRLRVLAACEFSAVVRDAFLALGHDAWSCDLEPTDGDPARHLQGDVLEALDNGGQWDLVLGFPPCTDLASSGARWWPAKRESGAQQRAVEFALAIADHPNADRVAIENPVGYLSTAWRRPDQIIQPWQFGHGEVKTTCLWLRGLPLLEPTDVVEGREQRAWRMPDSKGRARARSRTYQGVALAMASQWGGPVATTTP